MKLKFKSKKHSRINYHYFGVKIDGYWFHKKENKWHQNINGECCSAEMFKTLRGFKKRIKKLDYLPSGTVVNLIGRFVCHDVLYVIP